MGIKDRAPSAIAEILGERLKQVRLNADLTQIEVAERSGLSRKVVMSAEKGKIQLESLVAIMLVLDLSDALDGFLPETEISPLQLARLQGQKRQRASGSRVVKDEGSSEW